MTVLVEERSFEGKKERCSAPMKDGSGELIPKRKNECKKNEWNEARNGQSHARIRLQIPHMHIVSEAPAVNGGGILHGSALAHLERGALHLGADLAILGIGTWIAYKIGKNMINSARN